jgi:hypothetical protein
VHGKPLLCELVADSVTDGACIVRGGETVAQLASIGVSTLNAPEGWIVDRADAYAVAMAALARRPAAGPSTVVAQGDPLAEYDNSSW